MKDFYIASCGDRPDAGIYRIAFPEGGKPETADFTPLQGANYMIPSADRKTLYVTCGSRETGGGIAAFAIGTDGSLTELNRCLLPDHYACHGMASPDGKFFYTANYSYASVTEYRLAPDGSIAGEAQTIVHPGRGVREDRQESAHPHCAMLTPDGQYLCVADLGIDALCLYRLTPEGIRAPGHIVKMAPGSGPRHIIFAPDGKTAYLLNELGNSVTRLHYSGGDFMVLETVSSLAPEMVGNTKASAIRFSPDFRYLYASNRGFDTVAVWAIAEGFGALHGLKLIPSGGISPRDIGFLPDGKHFAACNEFSDTVTFFAVSPENGILQDLPWKLQMLRPLALFY